MASEREVAEFWADKALEAQYQMLETVRASASKWATAIAATLGVFATAGFVWGPDKLANLRLHGVDEIIVLMIVGLGGAAGVVAVVFANLAGEGLPNVFYDKPITGPDLMQQSASQARKAHGQLVTAIRLAGLAGLCVIVSSVWILVAAVVAPPAPVKAVVVTPAKAFCGTLVTRNGGLALELASKQTIEVTGGTLTIVPACPS